MKFDSKKTNGKLKIGFITHHVYPTAREIRVTKLAATMASQGHENFVFCPGSYDYDRNESFADGKIFRLKGYRSGGVTGVLFSPLPINPIWVWWLTRQMKKSLLDIVLVRDLRLALPTLIAARLCGIKVILDLGEHYPGMMKISGKQRLVHYIIRNHKLISMLEAFSVRKADWVWVVVEENRQRLKRYTNSIEVVSNYPELEKTTTSHKAMQRKYSKEGSPVVFVFLGLIDNIRGLDLAIDAFSILIRELNNIQIHIYGDGFFLKILEEKVRVLGLGKEVLFFGSVPEDQKYNVMATGDIGLLLHRVCDLTQHTVPNKLFDYMSIGLPIIATPMKPVCNVVETISCGVVVAENPEMVKEGMKNLVLDLDKRKKFGENGLKVVHSRYTWDVESQKAIRRIEVLASK